MFSWRTLVARLAVGAGLAGAVALAACGPSPGPSGTGPAAGGWHEFEGSWNAAGTRRTISLGGDRRASVVELTGSLLLAGPSRPGVGFRGEALAFADSATGVVGRAVWTDENGDRVYSEFRGNGTATGSRFDGTFLGGTGRYAGATGDYEFAWQYVVEEEGGIMQGRAVGLKGRVRAGGPQAMPTTPGIKP